MSRRSRWLLGSAAVVGIVLSVLGATTKIVFKGRYHGVFLLRGEKGYLLELKDDLYLGEGKRVIFHLDGAWARALLRADKAQDPGKARLEHEWSDADGSGYVMNVFPRGERLFTSFSRFEDSEGLEPNGLFVGGGLPRDVLEENLLNLNQTGMAYYDGRRWYHLWCNANESISSGLTPGEMRYPSSWKFLGSRVLADGDGKLTLTSRHAVELDGVPLGIERFAYFTAGEPYFKLAIRITNRGTLAASYFYVYGDDPWLGEYGTSGGNIGWVRDGLIHHEAVVDPLRHSFAGMFDYGNREAGVPHRFSNAANFIEWLGPNRPDMVYFSNGPGRVPDGHSGKVLLEGDERFIGLVWGPRTLMPGKTDLIVLAIGLAGNDPATEFPVKPEVKIDLIPW